MFESEIKHIHKAVFELKFELVQVCVHPVCVCVYMLRERVELMGGTGAVKLQGKKKVNATTSSQTKNEKKWDFCIELSITNGLE